MRATRSEELNIKSIVAALECFKTNQHQCLLCEYNPNPGTKWSYGCIAGQLNIVNDAVELIKTQEKTISAIKCELAEFHQESTGIQQNSRHARVLPKKELADWNEALWLELRTWYKSVLIPDAISAIEIKNDSNEEGRCIFINGHIQMIRLYEKQWRCWTKRPTKEEMEAALWLTIW